MGWLDGLPNWGPFRKGGTAVAERETTAGTAVSHKGPPLMLLVNDASGRASFKTHVFPDAESATDFVLYWFPNQSQGGIIAFWAMTQAPEFGLDSPAETAAEAVAMIRDVTREGVVYLFSFVDMDTARTFLREEVRHGTDLGDMQLYWAVPVRLTSDPWGKMMLTPSVPPGTAAEFESEAPASDIWSPPPAPPVIEEPRDDRAAEARTVFEEAPNAHTGVADPMGGIDDSFDLTSWVERSATKEPSRKREPEAKKPRRPTRDEVSEDKWEPPAAPEPLSVENEAAFEPAFMEPEAVAVPEPEAEVPHIEETSFQPPIVEQEPVATADIFAEAVEDGPAVEPVVDEARTELPSAPLFEDEADAVREASAEAPEESMAAEHPSIELSGSIVRVHTNGNGHKPAPVEEDDEAADSGQEKPPRKANTNGHKQAEAAAVEPVSEVITPSVEPLPFVERRVNDKGRRASDGPERRGASADSTIEPTAGDEKVEIRIDIHLESAKALKVKRWEVKESPFEGFDSPPGRF